MTDSAPSPVTPSPATPSAATPSAAPAKPVPEKAAPAPKPEDKPFAEFIPQLFLPALAKEIQSYGGPAPELRLEQGQMPVVGEPCWQVVGQLPGEHRFWVCFTTDNIQSPKTIAVAEAGANPSLLESFLIDEKKTTLALLVSRTVQRLNGQKWLGPN